MRGTPPAQLLVSKCRSPLKRNQGFGGKRWSQGLGQGKIRMSQPGKSRAGRRRGGTQEMVATGRKSRGPTRGLRSHRHENRRGEERVRSRRLRPLRICQQGLVAKGRPRRRNPAGPAFPMIRAGIPGPWPAAPRRTQPPLLCRSCQSSRLQSSPEKTMDKPTLGNIAQSD